MGKGTSQKCPLLPMAIVTTSLLSPDNVCAHHMARFADMPCHGTGSLGQTYVGPQENEEDEK